MKDKVAWVLLAEKNRTNKKMKELAKNFEKKKPSVNFNCDDALVLMRDIEKATKMGCRFITYMDDEYPEDLRNILSPPPYLYVKGNVNLLRYPVKVTIAGSREATPYGLNVAVDFAHELASDKVCIVSGGAKGIDAAAIRGAMRAGNRVIVVMGTGIDLSYPKENEKLFEQVVASGGVLVSEFPLGMGPLGHNFPIRNRIMTALGDAVVIVEAAERSGALISASHAMEQGKMLFAVPGNIDSPNSVGVNELLRDGALFALSGSEILNSLIDNFPQKYREAQNYNPAPVKAPEEIPPAKSWEDKENPLRISPYEKAVLNAVKSGKDTYEEILEYTEMETNKLTSVLTIMEIKGIIKLAFGNRYKIIG